jgi:hypothetical protein
MESSQPIKTVKNKKKIIYSQFSIKKADTATERQRDYLYLTT